MMAPLPVVRSVDFKSMEAVYLPTPYGPSRMGLAFATLEVI